MLSLKRLVFELLAYRDFDTLYLLVTVPPSCQLLLRCSFRLTFLYALNDQGHLAR